MVLPGGMNGRQLADEVLRRRPDLKVLFATGYTRNAIIHHGRLDPDVELLTKPFTADALARKVRQILDGGSSRVRANEAAGRRERRQDGAVAGWTRWTKRRNGWRRCATPSPRPARRPAAIPHR